MKALRSFCIDCSRTAVESITEIGQSLAVMKSLEEVSFDFYRCAGLTSLAEIGRSMQSLKAAPIKSFALNCKSTHAESATEIGKGIAALRSVRRLTLDFAFCASLPN